MSRDCGNLTDIEKRPFSSVPMKRNAFFFTFIALCPHGNSSYASGNVSADSRIFDSILSPLGFAIRRNSMAWQSPWGTSNESPNGIDPEPTHDRSKTSYPEKTEQPI